MDLTMVFRHRLEWMGALTKAVENSSEGVRYQIGQARQRREQREEELARRLSHMDIVEQTKYILILLILTLILILILTLILILILIY